MKMRVNFCYECGRKLRGNHHVEAVRKDDGQPRILHISCYKLYRDEYKDPRQTVVAAQPPLEVFP